METRKQDIKTGIGFGGEDIMTIEDRLGDLGYYVAATGCAILSLNENFLGFKSSMNIPGLAEQYEIIFNRTADIGQYLDILGKDVVFSSGVVALACLVTHFYKKPRKSNLNFPISQKLN